MLSPETGSAILASLKDLKGSFQGDIGIDVEVEADVYIRIYACWLIKRAFKVSSGTVEWYRSSSGTDFDNSEKASPVRGVSI